MQRLTILCVALLTASALAQEKDFSGSWVLDAEKSGTNSGPPAMVIKMTAQEFIVTMGEAPKTQTVTFKLDGTETAFEHGRSKAEWNGSRLVATIISERGPSSVFFSREGAWLVQERESPRGPVKLYFKKAP